MSVAKQMKAYEDHLYEEWKTQVEVMLPSLLKRNVLVKPTDKQMAAVPLPEESGDPNIDAGMDFRLCQLNIYGLVPM